MNFYTISYAYGALIAGISSLSFSIFVYQKNKESWTNRNFSLVTCAVAVWAFGLFLQHSMAQKTVALIFSRISYVGAILVPVFFLQFALVFLQKLRSHAVIFLVAYGVAVGLLLANLSNLIVRDLHPRPPFQNYVTPGYLYPFLFLYFFASTIYAHYLLIKELKVSTGYTEVQIRYFLLASAIGFTGGAFTFLPVLGIDVPPIGNLLIAFYPVIISYAILKYRLMEITVVLTKGTAYFLTVGSLLVPTFGLIIFFQNFFLGSVNYSFLVTTAVLIFAVVHIFPILWYKVERNLERFVLKGKYDYRETLRNFAKALVTILDLRSLSQKVIDTITDTMGVERASLLLLEEEKGVYQVYESRNISEKKILEIRIPENAPFFQWLRRKGEVVILEELRRYQGKKLPRDVDEKLGLMESDVCIPLVAKDKVIGIINLAKKSSGKIYSSEDIELLSTLANQTAIAVENAKLYEDLKRQKAVMRRADRLASLGTLTAGLAHEIRNPMVAIKTLTQLLPERLDDEEFRRDFLAIASGEVDRISSLINELLEFARPTEPQLQLENLREIMEGMILLISTESRKRNLEIVTRYEENLPAIPIDREQIKQVFLNILLNAIEATDERGQVGVEIRTFSRKNGERFLQVEIRDTGRGIAEEHLDNIFTPFFTTKDKGSGLGLSISHQIIQEHRGTISVESRIGEGASFVIDFPVPSVERKRKTG